MKTGELKFSLKIPLSDGETVSFRKYLTEVLARRQPPVPGGNYFAKAAEEVLRKLLDNHCPNSHSEPLEVRVEDRSESIVITFINRSTPYFPPSAELDLGEEKPGDTAGDWTIKYENLGRQGQVVVITVAAPPLPPTPVVDLASAGSEVEIRPPRLDEIEQLSRLFYKVYGYRYINDYIYYPEKLRERIASKDLISTVALSGSEMIGHVGLLRKSIAPSVYEAALGVVDPHVKTNGLFGRIFAEVMKTAQSIPMQFCVYDFVTNHDYSQRLVAKYGTQEMAIFVGSQSKETQVSMEKIGIGQDPSGMDRYSILLAIGTNDQKPFGEKITLPVNLGEIANFILEPMGIQWKPAARFFPLAANGHYETRLEKEQQAVIFNVTKPGLTAVRKIVEEWRYLLRKGYQYAAVETELNHPGIGQMHDILARHGFFIAGFIPYQMTNRLGFRFQSLGPTQVAFDQIKLSTERGRQLLEYIRRDYQKKALV